MKPRISEFLLPLPAQLKTKTLFTGRVEADDDYSQWARHCRAIIAEWWAVPPLAKGLVIALQITFRGIEASELDKLQVALLRAGHGIVWAEDPITVLRRAEGKGSQSPSQLINLKVIWNDNTPVPATA